MADDKFNVNLNGQHYNSNNLPKEIKLKGKNDLLSIFDTNKDGKLSKSEIKNAIMSILKEEKKVSGNYADGDISEQEANYIAKNFQGGKFKIGENFKKLVNELTGRINAAGMRDVYTKHCQELNKKAVSTDNIKEIDGVLFYVQKDKTLRDVDGRLVIRRNGVLYTKTEKIKENGDKIKHLYPAIHGKGTEIIEVISPKNRKYIKPKYAAKQAGLAVSSKDNGVEKYQVCVAEGGLLPPQTVGNFGEFVWDDKEHAFIRCR